MATSHIGFAEMLHQLLPIRVASKMTVYLALIVVSYVVVCSGKTMYPSAISFQAFDNASKY